LKADNLAAAYRLIQDFDIDWKVFGKELSVPYEVLDDIEEEGHNPSGALMELLREWLRLDGGPTWNDLLNALKGLGRTDLAERARNELSRQGIVGI